MRQSVDSKNEHELLLNLLLLDRPALPQRAGCVPGPLSSLGGEVLGRSQGPFRAP